MKKSSLKGHWRAFREEHRSTLKQSVDLEDLQPFGGGDARRCCLLLEHRALADEAPAPALRAVRKTEGETGRPAARPRTDESLEAVRERIEFVAAAAAGPEAPSGYRTASGKAVFRQGATVLPHVLTVAERVEAAASAERVRVTMRKSLKPPWSRGRPRTVEVPRRWVLEMCTPPAMTAFVSTTVRAIVPVDAGGRLLVEREIDGDDWKLLDELYRGHAGAGVETPRTLLDRIDYVGNLAVQLPLRPETQRKLVLYPKSGTGCGPRGDGSRTRWWTTGSTGTGPTRTRRRAT